MPKTSNEQKAALLLDQIDELLRSSKLRPGERRHWQAWRKRTAATPHFSPTTTKVPASSIPWEKLAFDALRQAGVLANRGNDGNPVHKAGQPTQAATARATVDHPEPGAAAVAQAQAPTTLPISVTIPARTITISSPLHLEILRLMSQEGLARSWRVAQRVLAAGLAENENSVRNALRRLTAMGLIDDFRERGKPVGWTPTRGGSRRLVVLTETGNRWYAAASGQVPSASELTQALDRHQSVPHGVAVLEARDYLRLAGYRVDDEPPAVLATVTERWGKRTEPDLVIEMDGAWWPVEVQREISKRVTRKWEKCIALLGRLALIVLSNEHLATQCVILQRESSNHRLHLAEIRLASLEDMQHRHWSWYQSIR